MPEERNELELSNLDSTNHMSLNILDIIKFLSELKLEYLGDEIATEIVVNFNAYVDQPYYIEATMNAQEIREQFNRLPNANKQLMSKKTIISNETAKNFFVEILKNSNEQNDFFIKDTEVKGSIVNTYSIVVIIACILIAFVYKGTEVYRGEIGETVSSKIGAAIVEYIEGKVE